VEDLQQLSISELANVDVTSVSKRTQPLSDAPSAVYVITHDDIIRSGARTLPDILRLAPNLQVAMINASSYAITARGFNGNAADKLLVMIDGRSVYTPLFGGVFWDEQDVAPEAIDRIEVISGPGATLWGANAVNGVINIITHSSAGAPGGVAEVSAGNRGYDGSVQYAGRISDDLSYRVFADGLATRQDKTSLGANAFDGWSREHGGFRLDWTPGRDKLSLTGDILHASEQQPGGSNLGVAGGHLQVTWNHALDDAGSALQLQAYYQESQRYTDGIGYWLNTYDVEVQHSFQWGERQAIVWGLGGRIYQDHFANSQPVVYLPASSVEGLGDVFAQDTISLLPALDLTVGAKGEKDPYAGVSFLPNVRLALKLGGHALAWGAISRSIRAPTLFDEDLQDTVVPATLIIEGAKDFKPEKLTAYELGTRFAVSNALSVSLSGYYNVYDDLRSVEWKNLASLPLILQWGNLMYGDTYGLEAWADLQVTPEWRLSAGGNLMHERLRFRPGASTVNNLGEAGDDPKAQASVRSSMKLGNRLSWMADLRYVDSLPDPKVPHYIEADTTLTWTVDPRLDLVFRGSNLLHGHHLEYELAGATVGNEVERGLSIGLRTRF
jgi:iron complex outermembrane receptor protein